MKFILVLVISGPGHSNSHGQFLALVGPIIFLQDCFVKKMTLF